MKTLLHLVMWQAAEMQRRKQSGRDHLRLEKEELDYHLKLSKAGKVSGCLCIHLISGDLHIYSTFPACFQAFELIWNGYRLPFPLQTIKAFLYSTRSRCCWLFKFGACYGFSPQLPSLFHAGVLMSSLATQSSTF